MKMRRCKICGKLRSLLKFPKMGQGEYRRMECWECYKARHRAYYAAKKQEYKTRISSTYFRWRILAVEAYGGKCVCCGELHPMMLAIDHCDNNGTQRRKEHGVARKFYRWLNENNYPPEFQLLCHNCNMAKHLNGGICPHQEGSTTRAKARTAKRPEVPSP